MSIVRQQGVETMADVNNEQTVMALNSIAEAVYEVDKTLDRGADGTNWTVADSVSNIAYELAELNKTMSKLAVILETKL